MAGISRNAHVGGDRLTAVASISVALSAPTPCDLIVYRGDTGRFRVTVTTPDLTPVDVSGATWDCDIRTTADADPPIAQLAVAPVAGDTSTVEVTLTESESSKLDANAVWDLEMTLDGEVITLLAGAVRVTKDVSREPIPVQATEAVAGIPGHWNPNGNAIPPANWNALINGIPIMVTPVPIANWTTGQYVTLGDGTDVYWQQDWFGGRYP